MPAISLFLRCLLCGFAALMLTSGAVRAQDSEEAALYTVTDVAADVTADSAAHARDQAVMQAQRNGFEQLLTRLGADAGRAAKMDDNGVAALVQAFEVQQEHASAVRYIGTFTVQFKPNAVRAVLNKDNISYSEERSRPVVILPVVSKSGRNILWEDNTKWRAAWEGSGANAGRVPLVVPPGGLDDVAVISGDEAVAGKQTAIQGALQKYQAGNIIVATFNGDPDQPDGKLSLRIDVTRYDESGRAGETQHLTLPPVADAKAMAAALSDGVKQVRSGIENNWKQASKPISGPLMRLPVTVPIDSLAAWNSIKARLSSVPAVSKTNVVALARGAANIEIEFRGEMPQLEASLAQQNLILQPSPSGAWMLRTGSMSP